MNPNVMFLFLSLMMYSTYVEGGQELPYNVKVSAGLYLKPVTPTPVLFSETTPFLISYNFTWHYKQEYGWDTYKKRCEEKTVEETTNVYCIIRSTLEANFDEVEKYIDTMYTTMTGLNNNYRTVMNLSI